MKNISQTYHKQKKNNALKNGIFFTVLALIFLFCSTWILPRVFAFRFDSLGSFLSQINPIEILTPENEEMNLLILGR